MTIIPKNIPYVPLPEEEKKLMKLLPTPGSRPQSSRNIRITNVWIIELRRILGKIAKSDPFQIRPKRLNPGQIQISISKKYIRTIVGQFLLLSKNSLF